MGAVLLVLAVAGGGYGYPLPFETANVVRFGVSAGLFVGYLYFARSLFRLPFALQMTARRYRHARQHYNLDRRAALFDGFYRGFLDRRRWGTGVLAVLDRLVLLVIVLIACLPVVGRLLVDLLGLLGAAVMLVVFIYTGRFALLVDDGMGDDENPFGDIPNLRRPSDKVF
jgi:hypothetical protein